MQGPTRRELGALLLAGAAVAAAGAAEAAPARDKRDARRKAALDEATARIRGAADALYAVDVPIGTEPAFVFRPRA